MTHLPSVVPSSAPAHRELVSRLAKSAWLAAALLCLTTSDSPGLQAQQIPPDSTAPADSAGAGLLMAPATEPVERARIPAGIELLELSREPTRSAAGALTEMLDGRIPGLTVSESSGETGAANFIRLRGPVGVHGQEAPLLYVDGVRVTGRTSNEELLSEMGDLRGSSRLDDFDPRDIASVQVLKGPAAAALYGGDADAGVLLVETRRGQDSGPRITLSTEQGLTRRQSSYRDDYVNLTDAVGITDPSLASLESWRPVRNPVTGDVFARFNPLEASSTSPFREGRIRSYGLTGRGEAGSLRYYVSARLDDDHGVLPDDALRRARLRANLDVRLLSSLELSLSASHLNSDGEMPIGNGVQLGMLTNGGIGNPITSYGTAPRSGQGCLVEVLGGDDSQCAEREGNLLANFDILAGLGDSEAVDRITGGLTARWQPAEWLSGRFRVGMDRTDAELLRVVPPETPGYPDGRASETVSEDRAHTLDLAFTATREFGDRISWSTSVGASYLEETFSVENRAGVGFAADTDDEEVLDNAVVLASENLGVVHDQEALYLQQRFGYSGRFFLDLGARVDDVAGRSGELNPIWSPTAGVSLVPSRLASWGMGAIDDLRLRVAWGRATRVFPRSISGLLAPAPEDSPAPNPEHQRTSEWEMGIDASALEGRLSAAFTHFRRTSRGSLILSTAPGFPIPAGPVVIENRGVEALVDARLLAEEPVEWDVTLTVATRNPEVTDSNGTPPALAPESSFANSAPLGLIAEGYAPGAIFGHRVASAERDAAGEIIPASVVLEEGDPDLNSVYLGRPHPTHEQSLATSLRLFGALRLHTRFDRAAGHVKMDATSWAEDIVGRRWAFRQAESTPEEQAALEGGAILQRSLYVHDADFVKWRSLTLSWKLPRSWMDESGGFLADARLTLGGRNLHTWTDYPGTDPETRSAGGAIDFSALDFFALPPVRSWFARLSLSF